MKITQFDRPTVKMLSAEAVKALQETAAKYGLTVEYSGGVFTQGSLTAKIKFSAAASASAPAGATADWERLAPFYGLSSSDFGKVFTNFNGKRFKIAGIKPGRTRYPILATEVRTGKSYKFPANLVKTFLAGGGFTK